MFRGVNVRVFSQPVLSYSYNLCPEFATQQQLVYHELVSVSVGSHLIMGKNVLLQRFKN